LKTTEKGQWHSLDNNRNKVVLIVNTASKCGLTPQYKGLEQLYKDLNEQYGEGKFEILAFPCNQFLRQEPGTDTEIQQFCEAKYKVTFPVFAKIDVNGPLASPLYKWLKTERKGFLGVGRIGWNFTKVRKYFFPISILFSVPDNYVVCD
jgi:glutathione peroxidase